MTSLRQFFMIARLIFSIAVFITVIVLAVVNFPTEYKRLQFYAYAAKNLTTQDRIKADDYFVKLQLSYDRSYRFISPKGKFPKKVIKAFTCALDSNTVSINRLKSPLTTPAYVMIDVNATQAKSIDQEDEIMLSVNGKVYPERNSGTNYFKVIGKEPSASKLAEKTSLVLEVSQQYLRDSIWTKRADDYVLPIIIKRAIKPICPKGQKPAWESDLVTRKGCYKCK